MTILFRTIILAALLGLGTAAHAFVPPTITIAPPFAMAKLQPKIMSVDPVWERIREEGRALVADEPGKTGSQACFSRRRWLQ